MLGSCPGPPESPPHPPCSPPAAAVQVDFAQPAVTVILTLEERYCQDFNHLKQIRRDLKLLQMFNCLNDKLLLLQQVVTESWKLLQMNMNYYQFLSTARMCVEPQYTNTKCHYMLSFYLSTTLRRLGLTTLAEQTQDVPSSWTVPHHLSQVEKFLRRNPFNHKAIRQWSARNVLVVLKGKERVDPNGQFPDQTVEAIWQNASSPELINRH